MEKGLGAAVTLKVGDSNVCGFVYFIVNDIKDKFPFANVKSIPGFW
jgi:hypothetical protein